MQIRVERSIFSARSTIGKLFIDGEFQCYTLEPQWRQDDQKPRAIPPGTYKLESRFSAKHNRMVPWVLNVPGFDDIEIHPGNSPEDTEGCLLVGAILGRDSDQFVGPEKADWIGQSQLAFHDLWAGLTAAWDRAEEVDITYVNQQ